jgi:hypothetical protein
MARPKRRLGDDGIQEPERVLLRHLRSILPDDELCADVLRCALRAANLDAVPTGAVALALFASRHVSDALSNATGSHLAGVFLDQFGAELATLSRRAGGHAVVAPNEDEPVVSGQRPKLRRSDEPPPKITASKRMKAVIATAPRTSLRVRRLSVLLVHADRVVRASLARALVNARFDVVAVDAVRLSETLNEGTERCVLVTDLSDATLGAGLLEALARHPQIRIVAWTELETSAAEEIVGDHIGVVLPTRATEVEVAAAVRRVVES